ncbi:hypothetical protein PoB_004585900 [Plakobranchus ocellatus]|uniref:Uncharacterized protein n=1 Tax=Plakobranchus ocellatus TaxID=259542 RepID=A0AAV4BGY5_9GAST|nr:hypothetical protein PoB_004585900 [Plakobranchus ocellatus]
MKNSGTPYHYKGEYRGVYSEGGDDVRQMDRAIRGYKRKLWRVARFVDQRSLYRFFDSKIATFLKERSPKSIGDMRDMAAKYKSAYSDILVAKVEVSLANVATGPTGKDRVTRPTLRDDWDANDRGRPLYKRSQSSGPPRGWRNKARGTQKTGKTQVAESRADESGSTLRKGRTRISVVKEDSHNNSHDNFSADFLCQTRYQRDNNHYDNHRRRFGRGGTNQNANYAKKVRQSFPLPARGCKIGQA